jgi:hypothetical protein
VNYDLAMMALEGIVRAPLSVGTAANEVTIEGSGASLKELARLLLLISSADPGEAVELQPGVHVAAGAPLLRVRVR